MGKKQQDKPDRYFKLFHYMMETDAWKVLSANARAVYLQIGLRYNGFNNGRLALSVRDAAKECGLARNTAGRCFKELIDCGFIEETRHGGLSRKTRVASEWRLTAFRCDLTGALTSRLFMQRGARARDNRLPRSRPQTGRRLSQTTLASVANDGTACRKRRHSKSASVANDGTDEPVLGGSPVANDGTHIVYHVGGKNLEADAPGGDDLLDASDAGTVH